jgi:DmsE family decaheme c-type cytochrome
MNQPKHGFLPAVRGIAVAGMAALSTSLLSTFAFAQTQSEPVCLQCHTNAMAGLAHTKHAVTSDPRTPFGSGKQCQACHGDATEHLKNPANPMPQRFKKDAPADAKSGVCLSCHADNRHLAFWESGRHKKNEVSCNNCHNIHAAAPPAAAGGLVRKDPSITPFTTTIRQQEHETCTSCHKQIRSQLLKTSHHPIIEGKVKCTSCHNPHGAVSHAMVKEESVNQLCTSCHTEKRGPFMFEHPPVEENCLSCHNSHGSNHARLLNERVPNLCQDCHDWSRHPGTYYSGNQGFNNPTPNTRLVARACLNCHTAVHGTNAPANRGKFFLR